MKDSENKDLEIHCNLSELTSESIATYEGGKILDCNSNFIKCFGYSSLQEIIGLNLFHFFPKVYREIVSFKNTVGENRLETLCVRKDSSTFPAEVLIKTIKRGTGTQVINALVIRDETLRKNLENELLKSTVFQRTILNSTGFAIITTDFNGIIKTFNKGAEKMFGFTGDDIIDKKDLPDLFSRNDLLRKAETLETELQRKVSSDFEIFVGRLQSLQEDQQEFVGVKKNKSKIISSVTATTLIDHLNEVTGYLFTINDITDRKKAEEEIVIKSQLLNGVARNMPVVIFKADASGKFTQAFGSLLVKYGYEESTVLQMNIYNMYPGSKEKIAEAYNGKSVSFIDSRKVESDLRYHEYYIFPDPSNNGGIVGFAMDVSERKVSERRLEESALHLKKMNEELDQFAYIVSHDLKAPLRAISNLSLWLEEDIGEGIDEDSRNNLALMRDRVQRMQNLIDGILSYSRVGRIKATGEEINVLELLDDVKQSIAIPDEFKIDIPENLPFVYFNKTWLEQVFTNLLSNALKYHHKNKGLIRIEYDENENDHIFSVADDGPGIAPEYHEKIFMIFQTLESKDKFDSTGIGLTIVKKIIEEHGGKIWVESDGKSGTTFSFTIPKKSKK